MSQLGAPSLQKIADASGVSVSTVSRVLLKRSNVSPTTRDRVVEVAKQMRYRPNMLVRGMQTGHTGTVGVMMQIRDAFYARVYEGIHDTLVAEDQVPILVWSQCASGTETHGGTGELDQIHRLVDRRVDGVILVPVEDAASDEYLHEIWDRNIPLIAVDRALPHSKADFVGNDDRQIGRLAAEHLLGLGHRRLGHLAGALFTSPGRDRREGFTQAVSELDNASCVVIEEPDFVSGQQAALDMLQRPDRPTAIFAANDHLALGIFDAAANLGLRIPHDLSVIGCGDFIFGRSLRPALTTIDQRPNVIGRHAASLLLKRKSESTDSPDPTDPTQIRVEGELVQRASTAPAPPTSP